MADDPLPALDATSTQDEFYGKVRSAGNSLKEKLRIANLTSNESDLAWSEISQYRSTLEDVMEQFRKHEFRKLHPHGELHWSKLFVTIRAASFPENYWGKRSEDAWLLTLFASDSDDIGRSFSMHSEFTVNEGDIHLGYVVKKA